MEAEKKLTEISVWEEALERKFHFDENCILQQSLDLIADKWTLLIVMALMQGTKRNSELQKQVVGISPKMLAQTLKTLLNYGMVSRKVYPEVPPKVEYSLTELGSSLAGPLAALFSWSLEREQEVRSIYKNQKK
ncbi:winged helix-turn-helix transcriptional regulator [Rufibacter sediminis]|uniref:Helix-turn-helix transcriptional regulator n=1 Tax=Rufibacter sediminis TaxID=2762756 RepID=A0ABR6VMR8_9BACT|nr:helix-turn-helix domain-containing protein [Rufibacter sediminis]MBC3538486.1 helix-turn-helix transcriptional regulator [Rufibacter sediminis]